MTRKYDYRMQVITIDEAMELLGYNDLVRFVGDVDKHLPTHSIPDSTVDMYSMSELKQFASSIGKEIAIPDEWKERCLCIEEERKREEKTEEVEKRLDHPYMEGHKCLESCSHRDDYGFCKQGDFCTKYSVDFSKKTVVEKIKEEHEIEYSTPEAKPIATLTAVEDVLFQQLLRLADTSKSDRQKEEERRNATVMASTAKVIVSSLDLKLRTYSMMAVSGIDRKALEKLV